MVLQNLQAALPGGDELTAVDIKIADGRIMGMAPAGKKAFDEKGGRDVFHDCSGLQAFPGGIDPHVHFFEPGYTHKEDFYHGSAAAASGGVTTIIDMPCTSIPDVTSLENLEEKLRVVEKGAVIDFAFHGGVSGQLFHRQPGGTYAGVMEAMAPRVTGFKCYMVSGMESFRAVDVRELTLILKKARQLRRPVLLHAEDRSWVEGAAAEQQRLGCTPAHYYHSRPEEAEILAIEAALRAAEFSGGSLHIVHVGTAEGARLIGGAQRRGVDVTGETCPHYLGFSQEDLNRLGAPLKTAPVVKSPGNAEGLWRALADDGDLLYAASDHAPGTREEKAVTDIWKASSGIPGTGTLFPYLYSEGWRGGRLSLSRLCEITSGAAARRFGLHHRKGALLPGHDADLVLMDPSAFWKVKGEDFFSKGKDTPFEGMTLRGAVHRVYRRGEMIYSREQGLLASAGSGRFLLPGKPYNKPPKE